jgi:hypothetical protein
MTTDSAVPERSDMSDTRTGMAQHSYRFGTHSTCHAIETVLKFVPVRTATPEAYAAFNE